MTHAPLTLLATAVVTVVAWGAAPASAMQGTCGPCPAVGACPPTFPVGVSIGEDHACEDLSGFDLAFALLFLADLTSADLGGARLDLATLNSADLTGASLVGALLFSASFVDADLTGTDLTAADVTGAGFHGANLEFAVGLDAAFGTAFYDCATKFPAAFDPAAEGWANVALCACVEPATSVRLGTPPNPQAFSADPASGPSIGSTWNPLVEHTTFVPAAVVDFALLTGAPANLPLGSPGVLLCDLTAPPVALLEAPAVGAPFELAIPNHCNLVGLELCLQGGSLDAGLAAHLSNAIDFTIGSF